MTTESLTYSELGDRLGTSPEAARSLTRRLRLPRKPGNDGKVRVIVDLAEIQYTRLAARSPRTQTTDINALNAQIERMQTELATLEVEKNCHNPAHRRHADVPRKSQLARPHARNAAEQQAITGE